MSRIVSALFHAHDTTTNVRRGSQPPARSTGVSKNIVIGIILGVIALIVCATIAFLLWRLARQHRADRRRAAQVDLLASPRISTFEPEDTEKGFSGKLWVEKPLPPPPVDVSGHRLSDVQGDLASVSALRNSVHPPASYGAVICTPPPAAYRNQSNASISTNSSTMPSLTHSRNATASSLGTISSHIRSHSNPIASETRSEADIRTGQFTVINVTESDDTQFQRPRLLYGNPPEYTTVRGRDPPFPAKVERKGKPRPVSIATPEHPRGLGDHDIQPTFAFPVEKRRYLDVPSTPDPPTPGSSYTVQLPPSSAKGSSLGPSRTRLPLTITASRPMSNVVVEELRRIRRPNGTQGKGRMVTMSVLVEDSDPSTSEVDPLEHRHSPGEATLTRDLLDQLLEGYAEGGLPPYTPRDEVMRR